MKICLLGEYSGDLDEGMRKVSFHFAEELSKEHQVLTLDLRGTFTKTFWKDIKNLNPEIIHYIHGPSIKSFILLKIISLNCRDAKTIMSAMHPCLTLLSEQFISLFKPELMLTQSFGSENIFKKCGCKTKFLPCGVDTAKFTPFTARDKEDLREKYGIDKEKFVILHAGSIKEGRNVPLMEKLQEGNNQVIIVGAVSTGIDKNLAHKLEQSGCLVLTRYFENIEEIYALSDCYLFPTLAGNKSNSIEMPLSVLEAMSCNLPVITTEFGALPRVFEEGDGLFFVKNKDNIINSLNKIKDETMELKTREKVLPFSWEAVSKKLENIYESLLTSEEHE
jgi:glycosyltransferase involved in cell wall biosynthesis